MRHPHVRFLLALVVAGPVAAIAGFAAGGRWGAIGTGIGAAVVSLAARRSYRHLRGSTDPASPTEMRMIALLVMVMIAAAALGFGCLAWLIGDLV